MTYEIKIDSLAKLNHVIRTEVLSIEASLLKMRKATIEYENARLKENKMNMEDLDK